MSDTPNNLEELEAANSAALQQLERDGLDIGVLMDRLRLEVLIALLMPEGNPLRLTFEAYFQRNLSEQCTAAASAIARDKLTRGVEVPKAESALHSLAGK